jgi:hypothetical protein
LTISVPDTVSRIYSWYSVYKYHLQIKISVLHNSMSSGTTGEGKGEGN